MDVELHAFFTSTLDGNEWSASRPGCIITEEGVGVGVVQLPMWTLSRGESTFTLSGVGKDSSVVTVA